MIVNILFKIKYSLKNYSHSQLVYKTNTAVPNRKSIEFVNVRQNSWNIKTFYNLI